MALGLVKTTGSPLDWKSCATNVASSTLRLCNQPYSAPASTTHMLLRRRRWQLLRLQDRWHQEVFLRDAGLVTSGPAISNGRIYFGSFDGSVTCLSLNGQ